MPTQQLTPSGLHEDTAHALLAQERFQEVLDILITEGNVPLSLQQEWRRGIALHGVDQHDAALAALRVVRAALPQGAGWGRCGLDMAIAHNRKGEFDLAQQMLDDSAAVLMRDGNPADGIRCQWVQANIHLRRGDYPAAIQRGHEAWGAARTLGLAVGQVCAGMVLAGAYRLTGQHAEFMHIFDEAWPLATAHGLQYRLAVLAHERATVAHERGEAETSAHFIALAKQHGQRCGARLLIGDILTFEANAASASGQFLESRSLHERARTEYATCGFRAGAALCHYNLASVNYQLGNYAVALNHCLQAETIATETNNLRFLRLSHLAAGLVYRRLGNERRAARYLWLAYEAFERAEDRPLALLAASEFGLVGLAGLATQRQQLRERVGQLAQQGEASVHQAAALRTFAELLMREGQFGEALRCLQTCTQQFKQAGALIEWAICCLLEGQCLIAQGEPHGAETLLLLDEVLTQVRGLPEFEARAMQLQSQVLLLQHQPEAALQKLLQALPALRRLRATSADPLLSGFLAQALSTIYSDAASLAHQQNCVEDLMWVAHERRSGWLLRHRYAQQDASVSTELARALNQIETLRQRVRAAQDRGTMAVVIAELDQAYRELDHQLQAQLRVSASSGPMLNTDADAGLAQFREKLMRRYGHSWTAIQFEPLDAHGKAWLLMRLTPHKFTHHRLTASPSVLLWLRTLTTTGQHYAQTQYGMLSSLGQNHPLHRLSEWLGVQAWLPDEAGTNHVLLIADCEPFTRLAFAALPWRGTALGARVQIRHLASWDVSDAPHLAQPNDHALFVAPGMFAQSQPNLPQTQPEIELGAQLWPGAHVLRKQEASLARLKEMAAELKLKGYAFIHFATHITFDRERPRLSGVALFDGDLSVQEILSWNLAADLVAVAGCEGALAWNLAAEERLGVERALLAAGACQVLSNLWPAQDDDASAFQVAFLQAYRDNGNASRALLQAVQQFAQRPAFGWAGWRISGV